MHSHFQCLLQSTAGGLHSPDQMLSPATVRILPPYSLRTLDRHLYLFNININRHQSLSFPETNFLSQIIIKCNTGSVKHSDKNYHLPLKQSWSWVLFSEVQRGQISGSSPDSHYLTNLGFNSKSLLLARQHQRTNLNLI